MVFRLLKWLLACLALLVLVGVIFLELRQLYGNREAARLIAEFQVEAVKNLGATRSLRILPLIEFYSSDPALLSEVGVSYLVETDDLRILFDVGHNANWESPSPLQRNMETLGIDLASIDLVFLSHNHLDHSGGQRWVMKNSFSLGTDQKPFPNPDTWAVVPQGVTYPGMKTFVASKPMSIGNGLGTTGVGSSGTMPRQLVLGWIEEHSLVVNVEGLGGVLIVGCGHQPLPNLILRYEAAFEEPLYGVVGGLHFPVPQGRIMVGPIDGQRLLASGQGLLSPMTMSEVEQHVAVLKLRRPGLVAVGSHDSSDEAIELLRREFGDRFRHVRVGEEILVGAALASQRSGGAH
jgi:7,8-dihydropterin-6-yl-methyl-4-(beta-D-ribofuranosyl)aminobenzene 5'-phosphate synthase